MSLIRSAAIAIIFAFFGVAGVSAASINSGNVAQITANSMIVKVQSCETLRRACENKDRLGERGEGNCRRYRETCLRPRRSCASLRRACLYKDERGERGQGNCREYREQCRGR